MLLRKKKYQEKLLQNADNQLEAIEKMTADLEDAVVQMDVLERLKTGNDALKKIHATMDIDQIEAILDETREGVEKQREIDELISGALTQEDEDDVLDEFNKLIQEETRDRIEFIDDDAPVQLPDVPQDELPKKNKVEDDAEKAPKRVAVEA